jgi:hypothetical protein
MSSLGALNNQIQKTGADRACQGRAAANAKITIHQTQGLCFRKSVSKEIAALAARGKHWGGEGWMKAGLGNPEKGDSTGRDSCCRCQRREQSCTPRA